MFTNYKDTIGIRYSKQKYKYFSKFFSKLSLVAKTRDVNKIIFLRYIPIGSKLPLGRKDRQGIKIDMLKNL